MSSVPPPGEKPPRPPAPSGPPAPTRNVPPEVHGKNVPEWAWPLFEDHGPSTLVPPLPDSIVETATMLAARDWIERQPLRAYHKRQLLSLWAAHRGVQLTAPHIDYFSDFKRP